MTGIISGFPGLGRVDLSEERLAKPSLSGRWTNQTPGESSLFQMWETEQKIYLLNKGFPGAIRCSVITYILHVKAQATGANFELLEGNFQNTNVTYALEFSWSDYETQLMLFCFYFYFNDALMVWVRKICMCL